MVDIHPSRASCVAQNFTIDPIVMVSGDFSDTRSEDGAACDNFVNCRGWIRIIDDLDQPAFLEKVQRAANDY